MQESIPRVALCFSQFQTANRPVTVLGAPFMVSSQGRGQAMDFQAIVFGRLRLDHPA